MIIDELADLVESVDPGPRGAKGEKGDRGLPGVNAVPADRAVGEYLAAQDTKSHAALHALDGSKGPVLAYDTVADLLASGLESGSLAVTKGYHAAGDGGAGLYRIMDAKPSGRWWAETMKSGRVAVLDPLDQGFNLIWTGRTSVNEMVAAYADVFGADVRPGRIWLPAPNELNPASITLKKDDPTDPDGDGNVTEAIYWHVTDTIVFDNRLNFHTVDITGGLCADDTVGSVIRIGPENNTNVTYAKPEDINFHLHLIRGTGAKKPDGTIGHPACGVEVVGGTRIMFHGQLDLDFVAVGVIVGGLNQFAMGAEPVFDYLSIGNVYECGIRVTSGPRITDAAGKPDPDRETLRANTLTRLLADRIYIQACHWTMSQSMPIIDLSGHVDTINIHSLVAQRHTGEPIAWLIYSHDLLQMVKDAHIGTLHVDRSTWQGGTLLCLQYTGLRIDQCYIGIDSRANDASLMNVELRVMDPSSWIDIGRLTGNLTKLAWPNTVPGMISYSYGTDLTGFDASNTPNHVRVNGVNLNGPMALPGLIGLYQGDKIVVTMPDKTMRYAGVDKLN
ncbi:hypothetical protein Uis1B_0620 [Bifidobacterium margollesii]|uniref:Uncharacterized protein n=1 Tax=Bifidobacterium margollesii TaxID=2020964 RepID=A0A2N5JBP6_9BIFI|nr:hypothetical protein [Bifidobacterium margollesii]PLS31628.1 hypothetical protein Uis1B_0620 [Bifidobacterium margollesii]